ncbi:MAG: HPP family protein [Syntrophotaleaceae bacterium]
MRLKVLMQIATMMLIMFLFAMVDIFGEKEILFPEIAALALGFWIFEKPPWQAGWLAVWASPTLAALTGVLLLRYVFVPTFSLVAIAFILVVLQLKVLRSEVFPSISAAILAIMTHTTSWLYPLSVGILMGIIVLGKIVLERFRGKPVSAEIPADRIELCKKENHLISQFIYWSKILAGVLIITASALGSNFLFMIAPPLIVAFVELSRPDQPLRRTPAKAVLLLFLAAFTGVLWFYLVTDVLHGPLWFFSGLALGTVFVMFHLFHASFPPVAAIALLPVLVPDIHFWKYPLHVLAGSCLFVFMGVFFFREVAPEPAPFAEN